jgi:hypothetical protein
MANAGIRHIDVGDQLTKTEWLSEETHELVHGTSFPASPVERQLFYRDDEHKWYIYNGSAWECLQTPPLPIGRPKRDGASMVSYSLPGVALAGCSTHTVVANRLYYEPIFTDRQITLDRLAIGVTTAAAGQARLGIYSADTFWQPTALILDAGEVDTGTTGYKEITINLTLTPGLYLLAFVANATPVLRTISGSLVGAGISDTVGNYPTYPFWTIMIANYTYAPLPSQPLPWNLGQGAGTSIPFHLVVVRLSTV